MLNFVAVVTTRPIIDVLNEGREEWTSMSYGLAAVGQLLAIQIGTSQWFETYALINGTWTLVGCANEHRPWYGAAREFRSRVEGLPTAVLRKETR
jgi:hypothetical protein